MNSDAQKFWRGHRVRIADTLPSWMDHFSGAGEEAIVAYSAADVHNQSPHEYMLLLLRRSGEPQVISGWYMESLLTLVDVSRDEGEQLLQKYRRLIND